MPWWWAAGRWEASRRRPWRGPGWGGSPSSTAITSSRRNLHRQWLFEESDAAEALPKAAAAERRISAHQFLRLGAGSGGRPDRRQCRGTARGARRDPRRNGQLRHPLPDQRFRRKPQHSVDLWGGRGELRAGSAGASRGKRRASAASIRSRPPGSSPPAKRREFST